MTDTPDLSEVTRAPDAAPPLADRRKRGRIPMRERMLHMIGNAHIDPVWLWQWPEGYEEVRATFRSALDRMNEYPDFVFTCDSAAYYEWVEESYPEMFDEIRRRVDEGRWEIVGGWWVEPDCNLPSGESFVRQGLYSQRYFAEKFGMIATVGVNVDPFGHNGMLPQILRKQGMDAYCFMRPGPHEMDLPAPLFWWQSADGSRVMAARIPHEYCSPREDLGYHLDKSLASLPGDWREHICFYGVGNHGGGPTKANIESIRRLDATDSLPRLRLSTTRRFFDRVLESDGELPVVSDDLQHHSVGCYTSHSGIKAWNRRAENLLGMAEVWSAIAARVCAQDYPLADLTRAWKNVLFNQFHDILGGTSIEPAYEEARDQLGESAAIAARALNLAVQSISRRIDIPFEEGTTPIVVFNPHAWPVRAIVESETGGLKSTDGITDENGQVAAFQETQSYATASDWRKRIALLAEVPPLGWRTYHIRPNTPRIADGAVRAGGNWLENEHVRLEIDEATGRVAHLVVKETGADLADASRPHALVVDDNTDTWSHRVVAYPAEGSELRVRRVLLVESGPARAIVRVETELGRSGLVEDYVLAAGNRAVEVRVLLDWREKSRLLKLRYPTRLTDTRALYEIPYGTIERPANGEEEPGQRWVEVNGRIEGVDGIHGLAVLNDAKYGFDVRDGDVAVTAVRSPIYAHHDPTVPRPEIRYQYQDQGFQRFTLALMPHAGEPADAGVTRRAYELNQRPTLLLESHHPGTLPQVASHGAAETDSLAVGAMKLAEDGSGDLVVRVVEVSGRGGEAAVALDGWGARIEADFAPHDIRTWRIPASGGAPIETDLLEQPLAE